jgi:hypothetical protein
LSAPGGPALPDTLVGAWGWEHESWEGAFYPGGLPPEWRLAFYANAFRAVLVPAARMASASLEEVEGWARDAGPPFVFYVELAPPLLAEPAALAARLERLEGRVGGLVLSQVPPGMVGPWAALAGRYRLACTGPGGPGPAGLAWAPGRELEERRARACFGLMDGAEREPRALREAVEAFHRWALGCEQAMLCFPGTPRGWRQMEQARLIAELLGG